MPTPRTLIAAFTVAASAALAVLVAPGSAAAANTVETAYDLPGPFTTTTGTATDGLGNTYAVYRPASYPALGFASPILTWGNGTNATPGQYSTLLTRMASYGFTVIASTLTNTGSGNEIDDGATYLVAQDGTAGSVYAGHLDTGRVGAFGHSQGATGAVNAATHHPARYTTVLTFSLPAQVWAGTNPDCPTAAACTPHPDQLACPAFLISTHGVLDAIIASPATETAYYRSVPGPASLGLVARWADHNTIQDSGEPGAELGYATAWFLYRLRGNTTAGTAFTGTNPELPGNPAWPGSLTR
jgi:pimeloyl-ACP methyl ester carboxylesterase